MEEVNPKTIQLDPARFWLAVGAPHMQSGTAFQQLYYKQPSQLLLQATISTIRTFLLQKFTPQA